MTDRLVHAGLAHWVVDRDGQVTARSEYERILAIGYTPAQVAAIDIMTDDRYPLEKAAELVLAAAKTGQDPEVFARHFVELRKAWRESPATGRTA